MFRPRVLVYGAVLFVVTATLVGSLYIRTPLKVDVIRDRAALAREVQGGLVENVYRLRVMNIDERPHRYAITATGLKGITVVARQPLEVRGASAEAVPVAVRIDPTGVKDGSHVIVFHVADVENPRVKVDEKSRFFVK